MDTKSKALVLAGAGLLGATLLAKMKETSLSIQPSHNNVKVGDNFNISIQINIDVPIYAAQTILSFNPTILEVISVEDGSFLKKSGKETYQPIKTDNVVGNTISASTIIGVSEGVKGNGTLTNITFKAKSVGISSLTFSGIKIINPYMQQTSIKAINDGEVKVT